jgi:transposase
MEERKNKDWKYENRNKKRKKRQKQKIKEQKKKKRGKRNNENKRRMKTFIIVNTLHYNSSLWDKLSCIYRKLSKEIIRESAIHSPTVNK